MGNDFKGRITDKSYGLIGASRVSSSAFGRELFMSDVTVNNFIELKISQASVSRGYGRDWTSAEKSIIKVYITPVQWAEMLTCLNVGDGVPCTIAFTENDGYIKYKPLPSKIDMIEQESVKELDKAQENIKDVISVLESAKGKGSLTKKQIAECIETLKKSQYVSSNTSFIREQAKEEIGRMVTQAKAQVSEFIDHKIYSTGINALKEGFVSPELIEERKED